MVTSLSSQCPGRLKSCEIVEVFMYLGQRGLKIEARKGINIENEDIGELFSVKA